MKNTVKYPDFQGNGMGVMMKICDIAGMVMMIVLLIKVQV